MLRPEYALTRSQDLEEYFHDAGNFIGRKSEWISDFTIF